MRQTDLSQLMTSDSNTITSILSRMENSGWVKREAHLEDQRARQISITDIGDKLYGDAQVIASQLQEEVLSGLTEAERSMFLELMSKVSESCLRARSST